MRGLRCCMLVFSSCSEQQLLSSCMWELLIVVASLVANYGLSSCGTQAYLPRGMWNFPGSGIKPVFPALAGGFLTIGSAGKSHFSHSDECVLVCLLVPIATYSTFSWWPILLSSFSHFGAQSLGCVQLFATLWTTACQASLSIVNSQSLLKLMSTESVMPSNNPILCYPLLLLLSIFLDIRVFSNKSILHIKVAKVLEFQLQHQSFQCTFRTDFF